MNGFSSAGWGEAEVQAQKARADGLGKVIEMGKTSLAETSYTDSVRKPGRYSGGETGLVKIADLRPEIDGTLPALTEDKISLPMETKGRQHISKKGRFSSATSRCSGPMDIFADC